MYVNICELWLQDNRTSHAITLSTHDKEVIKVWEMLGFGKRCVDAIVDLSKVIVNDKNDIRLLNGEQIEEVMPLAIELKKHFSSNPIFIPTTTDGLQDELLEWFKEDDHYLFGAYDGEKLIGYMRIEPEGESYVSKATDVMNITAAYTLPEYRGKGIGQQLLNALFCWLIDNNYKYCGVDFETFNIVGAKFWFEYFTPYTFSYTRRVDERILR